MGSRVTFLAQNGDEIVAIVATIENHKHGNTVTEYPVEKGFKAADGAQNIPVQFTFTGVVPDDFVQYARRPKLNVEKVDAALRSAGSKIFNDGTTPRVDFNASASLAQGIRDVLHDIVTRKILITVVTAFRPYINMMITDFTEPGDASTVNDFKFSASFKQITVAESTTVFIDEDILADDANPTAATPQDAGKQTVGDPNDATKEKGESILTWITGIGSKP